MFLIAGLTDVSAEVLGILWILVMFSSIKLAQSK